MVSQSPENTLAAKLLGAIGYTEAEVLAYQDARDDNIANAIEEGLEDERIARAQIAAFLEGLVGGNEVTGYDDLTQDERIPLVHSLGMVPGAPFDYREEPERIAWVQTEVKYVAGDLALALSGQQSSLEYPSGGAEALNG